MNTARIIDGRKAAAKLRNDIAASAVDLKTRGRPPGLAVIMVGDNPASDIYVRNKSRACAAVGIRSFEHRLPATAMPSDIERLIHRLNADSSVHGILLQLPVPPHINSGVMIELIAPEKDVDGLHPLNIGRLAAGLPGMTPCT
ncbi:MAG TPA: tetrahydrofolate dehydrogenase/cyclohydrolase catalytic domain-containing protein, partial [Micavibrio sp.]